MNNNGTWKFLKTIFNIFVLTYYCVNGVILYGYVWLTEIMIEKCEVIWKMIYLRSNLWFALYDVISWRPTKIWSNDQHDLKQIWKRMECMFRYELLCDCMILILISIIVFDRWLIMNGINKWNKECHFQCNL